MNNPHTLLDELVAPGQSFDTAFHWLTRVPESAIRLPNWEHDLAIKMWTSGDGSKRRMQWCHETYDEVDLMSTELLSKEWEVWRLK